MTDQSAALRHVVYRDLLCILPPASVEQTAAFVSNLSLSRFSDRSSAKRPLSDLMFRLKMLRVSPEIATATFYYKPELAEIEENLERKFSDRLAGVAGFYQHSESERWKLNLPQGCALHAYKSRNGFLAGFLCQPLNKLDSYFLLSSAKFGGPKAVRLEENDRQFFEQYKEPLTEKPPVLPEYAEAQIKSAQQGQNVAI